MSTVRTVKLGVRIAQHILFRAAVALTFLVIHLGAITHFAAVHWGLPFNSAPGEAPTFESANYQIGATNWNRLVVSRWDSGHYICMTLDAIYSHCPREDLRGANLPDITTCDLAFYPGYSILGWLASLGGKLPVDYALFGVSLASSFLLLFLWTGPVVVKTLGVWGAYCSLLLFNVFTTGFTLTTILTEPATMLFTFGAFVCLEKRRFFLGALLAGAASGMRVTGLCAPLAYSAAVLLWAWDEEDLSLRQWLAKVVTIPLSAWGVLTMMAYDWWRFKDPFIYAHAHQQAFGHDPQLWHLFWPDTAWVVKSMAYGVHDIAVAAIMVLWFALGHRSALKGLSRPSQIYWYVEFVVALCLPLYGSAELGYPGVTRYMLLLFGSFFAMASILKSKPFALVVWCVISVWHYVHSDLCYYSQHLQPGGMDQCLVDVRDPPQPPVTPAGILRFRGVTPRQFFREDGR